MGLGQTRHSRISVPETSTAVTSFSLKVLSHPAAQPNAAVVFGALWEFKHASAEQQCLLHSHSVLVPVRVKGDAKEGKPRCLSSWTSNTHGQSGYKHVEKHLVALIKIRRQVQMERISGWPWEPMVLAQGQRASGRDQDGARVLLALQHSLEFPDANRQPGGHLQPTDTFSVFFFLFFMS